MGEWDNTAFIATADAAAVADVVGKLFEASGRVIIARPEPRPPVFPDPMQYGTGATTARWAAAVLAGNHWTVVKTAPFELLCEAVDGVPRLALLAKELACDAFQLNLYDGDSSILVEANAAGAFYISGMNLSEGPVPYHGFPISEADFEAAFRLLRVPSALSEAIGNTDVAAASRRIRDLLHGDPDGCDNLVQVGSLIPNEPLVDALVIYAEREPPRPLREPLAVGLAVDRTESEARHRLTIGEHELWLDSGAGASLAPRASSEAVPIVEALARWLGIEIPLLGERVPGAVSVFGDLDDGRMSIGDSLPIGITLDEARDRARFEELDATVAEAIVRTCQHAWTGTPVDCLVPHVERVPLPPHRTVRAIAAGDRFVIACGHDRRTTLHTWLPDEAPRQIAEIEGRFEQLERGPRPDRVTLRVGHGEYGHGHDDRRDILSFDLSGARTPVLEGVPGVGSFAWSPDGSQLAIQMNRPFTMAERKRFAEAARAGKPLLGASARYYVELRDTLGRVLGRSPDHVELVHPRWLGDRVFCHRHGEGYVSWHPADDAIDSHDAWLEQSPTGVELRGDHEGTWLGAHRVAAVRPHPVSDPLAWLDAFTCVLVREHDPEMNPGLALAVDVRDARIRPIVASTGALPCAQLDDAIVANARGWRLWWGRRVSK